MRTLSPLYTLRVGGSNWVVVAVSIPSTQNSMGLDSPSLLKKDPSSGLEAFDSRA